MFTLLCEEGMYAGSNLFEKIGFDHVANGDVLPIIAVVFGCLVGMVAIVSGAVCKIATTRAREKSRRELAAYIAEGTLDPDRAIALMQAGEEVEQ